MPRDPRSCRGAQLFGAWAIEPERFGRLVASARSIGVARIVASHDAAIAAASPGRPRFQTAGDGVAVIDVSGPLTKHASSFQSMFGGSATLEIRRALRDAVADPDIKSILLRIDSPGGIVDGTADLVDDIRDAGERKAVWSFIEDLGASAAYWIASAADRIVANRTALVGSIGVFSVLEDSSGAAELNGVKVHVVRTGPHKGAGVEGAPVTEGDLADMQRVVDSIFLKFHGDVGQSRGLEGEALDKVATGQVWIAGDARRLGLVDAIDSLSGTIQRLGRSRPRRVATKGSASTRTQAMPMHDDIDNDTDVTNDRKPKASAPSAPQPPAKATIAELKAEFPGAGSDFYVTCIESDLTIDQARKANGAALARENADLKAKLAAKDAEAKAQPRRIGAAPVGDSPVADSDARTARQIVDEKVGALVASGMKPHLAHQKVMRSDAKLREQYVEEANAAKRG